MKKLKAASRVADVAGISAVLLEIYRKQCGVQESVANDKVLEDWYGNLDRLSNEMIVSIKKDKIMSKLDELDGKRDDVIHRLSKALTGYAALYIESKSSAAESLLAVFNKYGVGMADETYVRESALIESLLIDMGTDTAKKNIDELEGISGILEALRKAQDEFSAAQAEFASAKSEKSESASSLKKPVLALLNDSLIPYLNIMQKASPAYEKLAAESEIEINRVNASLSRKQG